MATEGLPSGAFTVAPASDSRRGRRRDGSRATILLKARIDESAVSESPWDVARMRPSATAIASSSSSRSGGRRVPGAESVAARDTR